MHRPRKWQEEERRRKKKDKRQNWSSKGGYIAPLFVPATPGGELAEMLRKVVEDEAEPDLRFNVVESGGRTVKSEVQTGWHKTWYPGNGVTSQTKIWQPKFLTGPEAQPAILAGP